MLCVISRQKRNFKKHRKCLKSLMLTCKRSYHLYGQGKDVFVQAVLVPFRNLRTANIPYLVHVACESSALSAEVFCKLCFPIWEILATCGWLLSTWNIAEF